MVFINTFGVYAQGTTLTGKVMDGESNKALEFSNVALLHPSDSAMVHGVTADIDGNFQVEVPEGEYLLRIGFIGYTELYKVIEVAGTAKELGEFKLISEVETLEAVTVSGVASMFESDIDKRTYNVENSILAEGATASQLLNTLPSIQMDEEGGIAMRGSGNVQIFINGRPTNMSSEETESILAQFPANSLKSVELITNPSSRYDAQGAGGIINIVLKKDERIGFNGQANIAVGTRDKYQTGINLNYGAGKVNYFAAYNFQYRDTYEESESLRRNFRSGASPLLDQDFNTRNFNQSQFLQFQLLLDRFPAQQLEHPQCGHDSVNGRLQGANTSSTRGSGSHIWD